MYVRGGDSLRGEVSRLDEDPFASFTIGMDVCQVMFMSTKRSTLMSLGT